MPLVPATGHVFTNTPVCFVIGCLIAFKVVVVVPDVSDKDIVHVAEEL